MKCPHCGAENVVLLGSTGGVDEDGENHFHFFGDCQSCEKRFGSKEWPVPEVKEESQQENN